jgi:hypothetical protein
MPALGLRLLDGRLLTGADARSDVPRPTVITASLGALLWPGQSAIGQRVRVGFSSPDTEHVVVGVVRDFAYGSMRFDPRLVMLTPPYLGTPNTLSLVIQTRDPGALAETVRRTVADLVPDAPRLSVVTGRELVAADLGRERLGAWFFSGFGLVAVVLGIGGVFGLISYLAESRRREFGVRIALGATATDVVRFALLAGLVPSAIGAGVGLFGAAWLADAAAAFLIGVSRFDVLSYGAAFALMVTVAAGAGLAAAWRVRRISPMDALRSE